ncbi:MAG TPA: GAF domain-containing protein [Ramlibacter sp.]|jgi:signal transduction histidine kinase/CheY-like chemotaxis protein|nr:GAF domain-containing protein [Ramlibacter sp.]
MSTQQDQFPFLGDGDMARLVRLHDWSRTAVGPVASWPGSLRHAVATLLECKLPMYLAWGPQHIQFYNDAYRPILGSKHPAALGARAPDTWDEIWPTIGPMWRQVLAGEAIGFDDFKLTINRFGYMEDCYFNFSYSPVRDDDGRPWGVLVAFTETTARVVSERRLKLLDELSQRTRNLDDPREVMQTTAALLGQELGVSRCAYANVLADQDTFDLLGDYTDGVHSIVGRYRFTAFGDAVHRLMLAGQPYVNDDVDTDPRTAGTDLSAYRATAIQAVVCIPLLYGGRFVAAMAVHQSTPRHWHADEIELVQTVVSRCFDALERIRAANATREEARLLEVLNRTGTSLAGELDLERLLQRVTDAATELTGARFGAFFYNGVDANGQALMLYTLSGAPREAFEGLGHPRPTAVFGPTFRGEPPLRIDDVLSDPRYGQSGPHHGMPSGHLPVRSYLAVPVTSRPGTVIGALIFGHPEVGVFSDKSERLAVGIAAQAAIAVDNARLYAEAQRAAAERHALLESERAARTEAERASALKDQFLATLSHELRTPLSAILGWVHILRRKLGPEQPELAKGVDVIERSTRVQTQLIGDLLDMSRITSGKMLLELQPIAPAGFVQGALDLVRPTAEAAGVRLVADLRAVGTIHGDAARLQQVVWNLLANAVKFTPAGGEVRLVLDAVGDEVEITVSDNGVGIRPEFLPYLFDRFRQADGSTTRRFGGLGLGLSIVKHILEAHGATVAAASAGEGQGSTFRVRLPTLAGASAGREPAQDAAAESLAGIRVLVADDDTDAREMLQRVLQDCGASVAIAGSAQAALEHLARDRFDVLVSDIGMPGMDGYELLRRVRQLPRDSNGLLPAIALTAFARSEDRQRALDAGFAQHLAKPFDPSDAVRAIARLHASH